MKRHEKPVELTRYARHRMDSRGISRQQVRTAVHHPDRIRKAKSPGLRLYERKISTRRRLVVIADEQPTVIRIINAYWLARPKSR